MEIFNVYVKALMKSASRRLWNLEFSWQWCWRFMSSGSWNLVTRQNVWRIAVPLSAKWW